MLHLWVKCRPAITQKPRIFCPTKIPRYKYTNHTPSVFSVCSSSVLVTGRRGGRAGEGDNESCFMDYNYRSYYN